MFWPRFSCRGEPAESRRGNLTHPQERRIWVKIRILHETGKAVLIDNGTRIWIPKSQIHKIRLRDNIFEVHLKKSTVG